MSNGTTLPGSIVGRLVARLNLRFPVLVGVLATLTVVDLVVPDFVPFVDEIGLALLTVLLSRWKARKETAAGSPRPPAPPGSPETIDVTARRVE